MLFLELLNAIAAVLVPVTDLILPSIPADIVAIVYEALRMISNSVQYVVWFLWTPSFFGSVVSFLLSFYVFLYGLDLAWKAINLIKLKRNDG